jgi:hypothetical protein
MTMGAGIFLIDSSGELVELSPQAFVAEIDFQLLLAKYPGLLAGGEINPEFPRRWLLVDREVAVPDGPGANGRWSLDHLFIDQDGIPTLVEVKRAADTRLRREVVGQMFDYAAHALSHWSEVSLRILFEQRSRSDGASPDQELSAVLAQELEPAVFWQKVKDNLQAGRIRMIFVADSIPAELRHIVEFLNEQLAPAEVFAVELRQFTDPGRGIRGVAPKVFGRTPKAEQRKAAGGRTERWTAERFFPEISRKAGATSADVARRIHDWAIGRGASIWWGSGRVDGSFFPNVGLGKERLFPVAIWTYGKLEFQFQTLKGHPAFSRVEDRERFRQRLLGISGVEIRPDQLERLPSVPLTTFSEPGRLELLFEILESECQRAMAIRPET